MKMGDIWGAKDPEPKHRPKAVPDTELDKQWVAYFMGQIHEKGFDSALAHMKDDEMREILKCTVYELIDLQAKDNFCFFRERIKQLYINLLQYRGE